MKNLVKIQKTSNFQNPKAKNLSNKRSDWVWNAWKSLLETLSLSFFLKNFSSALKLGKIPHRAFIKQHIVCKLFRNFYSFERKKTLASPQSFFFLVLFRIKMIKMSVLSHSFLTPFSKFFMRVFLMPMREHVKKIRKSLA